MRPHRRELALAGCVLAALALAGCGGGKPSASPSPSPTVSPTPSSPSPSLSPSPERRWVIGVLGDYGVDDQPVREVVRLMRRWSLDAVVTTGDNAYCCGTAAQSAFAKRMVAPLGVPVYPALGNHDVATSSGAPFMSVFGMTARWYTATVGPVQLVVLDANHPSNAAQLAFLKRTLAGPRPAFRVVAFHQPGWSCSFHPPEPGVVERWLPLFGSKVDLVLAGHNHTYERFRAANGTPYVTTGGGGAPLYPSVPGTCRGAGRVKVMRTVHHAVRLVATATSLRLEAIGVDGKAFDSVTLRTRR